VTRAAGGLEVTMGPEEFGSGEVVVGAGEESEAIGGVGAAGAGTGDCTEARRRASMADEIETLAAARRTTTPFRSVVGGTTVGSSAPSAAHETAITLARLIIETRLRRCITLLQVRFHKRRVVSVTAGPSVRWAATFGSRTR
jgi:hypothetical protein